MRNRTIPVIVFIIGAILGSVVTALIVGDTGEEEGAKLETSRLRDGSVISAGEEKSTYENTKYAFSITYPKDFSVQEFDEGGNATTVVFQGKGEEQGFQLFITPYGENTISEARIKQDLQGASMRDSKEVILGGGIRAVLFTSDSPIIGESREVWFIHNGYLFEATTYAPREAELAGVLATLSFN